MARIRYALLYLGLRKSLKKPAKVGIVHDQRAYQSQRNRPSRNNAGNARGTEFFSKHPEEQHACRNECQESTPARGGDQKRYIHNNEQAEAQPVPGLRSCQKLVEHQIDSSHIILSQYP